jgi:hypothetical protein
MDQLAIFIDFFVDKIDALLRSRRVLESYLDSLPRPVCTVEGDDYLAEGGAKVKRLADGLERHCLEGKIDRVELGGPKANVERFESDRRFAKDLFRRAIEVYADYVMLGVIRLRARKIPPRRLRRGGIGNYE